MMQRSTAESMATSTFRVRRSRRTTNPPISYRDESNDDETAPAPPPRFSQRLRRINPSQNLFGEESDTLEGLQASNARCTRTRADFRNASRAMLSDHQTMNVAHCKEGSDSEYHNLEPQLIRTPSAAPKPSANPRKRARSTRPALKKGPFHAFKRRKVSQHKPDKVIKPIPAAVAPIPPGKIPPWQTLPYQILLSIFQYASYPFYRDASHDTGSIAWLINVSALSKSFHDAAAATLLYSPPLFPADRARGLQRLLDAPQETLTMNYRNKVKRLDVEVRNLLIKKSGIDLINLIKRTPLLSALDLYHNYDRIGAVAWAQPSASTGRSWCYPLELFEALDQHGIRLRDWTWNGRFPDTKSVLDQMKEIHCHQCLKTLHSLSILNMAAPGKVKDVGEGASEDLLTTALNVLTDLRELEFRSCGILNHRVLASLPSDLRRLSIINCGNFGSADLRLYLMQHGYQLEELILKSNQALDLAFTESLETLCPRLRLFSMDLTYSDPTAYHDVDPHYEAAFPDGMMATWPRTLRTIEIENLRNLDARDAESFLESLIAIAPELTDLRRLSIRILLQDDGWRERAKMRQTWMPRLEDVFLRQAAPSAPFIARTLLPLAFPTTTTSSRPSTSQSNSSSSLATDESKAPTPNKRKSARIAKRELDGLARDALVKATSSSKRNGRAVDQDDLDVKIFRQGMCSEVILHIDGQRPADEQFKEADFLDDEVSGDEDWNGRDVEAPSRYAW